MFAPRPIEVDELGGGEVGFLAAGIKDIAEARSATRSPTPMRPCAKALPGFMRVKPMVFAGLYPIDSAQYEQLRDAIDKLRLNDSSFTYEPETSTALGFGFRCGFLGLLHMEIMQERLEREFGLELITTAPTVATASSIPTARPSRSTSPPKLPDPVEHRVARRAVRPRDGALAHRVSRRRASRFAKRSAAYRRELKFLAETRAIVVYDLPLSEIVFDFYDKLKSVSRGYASLDYEPLGLPRGCRSSSSTF